MRIPASASAGRIDSFQTPYCCATSCSVRRAIRCNWAIGFSPSAGGSCGSISLNACSRSPATRTMKNSSKFDAKIARNFTRSKSGLFASSASSSTRALNSNQLNSRLMKCSGRKVGKTVLIMQTKLLLFRALQRNHLVYMRIGDRMNQVADGDGDHPLADDHAIRMSDLVGRTVAQHDLHRMERL